MTMVDWLVAWLVGARPTLSVYHLDPKKKKKKKKKKKEKEITQHLKHVIYIKANANNIHVWDNSSGTEIIEANYFH